MFILISLWSNCNIFEPDFYTASEQELATFKSSLSQGFKEIKISDNESVYYSSLLQLDENQPVLENGLIFYINKNSIYLSSMYDLSSRPDLNRSHILFYEYPRFFFDPELKVDNGVVAYGANVYYYVSKENRYGNKEYYFQWDSFSHSTGYMPLDQDSLEVFFSSNSNIERIGFKSPLEIEKDWSILESLNKSGFKNIYFDHKKQLFYKDFKHLTEEQVKNIYLEQSNVFKTSPSLIKDFESRRNQMHQYSHMHIFSLIEGSRIYFFFPVTKYIYNLYGKSIIDKFLQKN